MTDDEGRAAVGDQERSLVAGGVAEDADRQAVAIATSLARRST